MESSDAAVEWWAWSGFIAFILALLAVDMLLFRGRRIGVLRALWLSAFYIAAAGVFGVAVFLFRGSEAMMSFFTGYALEKALSLDNIFVFVVIFRGLGVPDEQQHRVLVVGVLSALVLRGAFIALGATLLTRFDWLMMAFGAFLVLSGARLFCGGGVAKRDPKESRAYRFLSRRFNVTEEFHDGLFFIRDNGRRFATPLLVALVMIELADIAFALDSIPAIFSVTRDPFIVYSATILAVLGLRALYFALRGVIEPLRFLKSALALLLVLIGAKILLSQFVEIPVWATLVATLALLAGGVALSFLVPGGRKSEPAEPGHS